MSDLTTPAPGVLGDAFGEALLRRVEDAGLNASAPTQQRWMDGWIVRLSPGKAKRARCVNAVAPGVRPAVDKMDECIALYHAAGLPPLVRITPWTEPAHLDGLLAARGWTAFDPSLVLVRPGLDDAHEGAEALVQRHPRPAGVTEATEPPERYATVIGALRGSSAAEIAAHTERLRTCPVPYTGLVWRDAEGSVLACGQFAPEGPLAGLYDVHTAPAARGRGLAQALCARLLQRARQSGASIGYLQVGTDQVAARAVYRRLGFVEAYGYHYRGGGVERD
jgi:ribosomal protein S18 acetylase RimI-like enzyme